jgi:hypothetical protein
MPFRKAQPAHLDEKGSLRPLRRSEKPGKEYLLRSNTKERTRRKFAHSGKEISFLHAMSIDTPGPRNAAENNGSLSSLSIQTHMKFSRASEPSVVTPLRCLTNTFQCCYIDWPTKDRSADIECPTCLPACYFFLYQCSTFL